ncbi:hypothetical protein PFISCL1PPCAC_27580 [Pristionchus fissidentatus]|uniref:Amino acid transporter transmembrane domain-containing protein n=1 Tax=Pristionchus fissidentatus TaxID=1538716 RepID=A0AAV5X195_9BILA|nr:hypothetical protein PFISCL1PPCAC_27580 [Pristionchus fissidentatus]
MSTGKLSISSLPSLDAGSVAKVMPHGEHFHNSRGLGWFVTGLFVVGDLAGGGIVALPTALIQTDFYLGVVLMIVMTFIVTYTSYVLGRSWTTLTECWPEYRHHTRKPYAEIGFRANGPIMRIFVSIICNITQFMIAVVYILLASKNIQDAVKAFAGYEFSFCIVVIILGVCLLPLTFLKSPADFWWAVVIAMITTSIAVILIVVGAVIDYGQCSQQRQLPDFKVTNIFLALGTFLFSYGGHTAFPTIQHDMKTPADFTKSTFLAFSLMAAMYLPTGIVGYLAYGDSLRESVINSIQTIAIQQTINLLITVHLILTLTIVFNPINQEMEELFKVPQSFCWQRVLVRTGIMVAVVFVAESIPSFGPLLDLVGGSTLTLSSIVFPCIFFVFVNARKKKMIETGNDAGPASFSDVMKYNKKWILVASAITIVFGLIGGGAATFSAIVEITSTKFEYPCYVSPFLNLTAPEDNSSTNCCGMYQDIKVYNDTTCSIPNLDFYK